MVRSGSLKGRLVDKSGKPVKGVSLKIWACDWAIRSEKIVTTDDQGKYIARDIFPAAYSVNVSQDAGLTAKAVLDVEVKAGETAEVQDMVAVPGVFVAGRVVDAETGKPITMGDIYVTGPMTGGINSMFCYNVDDQGRFTFRAYPGEVRINYSSSERLYKLSRTSQEVDVPEGGLSDYALKVTPAQTITGKVLDAKGQPLMGAGVCVDGEYGAKTATDSDGSFTALVVPKDHVGRVGERDEVVLEAIDTETRQGIYIRLDREELPESKNLTIALKPARQLRFTVKDLQGKPLSGVQVQLIVCFSSMIRPGDVQLTDENGQAVFDVYEDGDYRPTIKLQGYYYANTPQNSCLVGSEGWTDTCEITMDPATRVQKGRVVDEAGNPAAGVTVEASAVTLTTTTDADGRFTLEGMPDAEISVNARRGSSYGYLQVSKDSGDVTIRLEKH